MKEYTTSAIRNICLLGHGGAGKTTLAEAMIFNTGVLDRLGKVVDGTSTMDYDPEEIKRKFSISTAIASCEWDDCKINIIDTPGYFDFVGEVKQGIRVADGAVILLPAKSGPAVGTEKSWAFASKQGIAKCFVISKMDEENANFDKALNTLKNLFGNAVIPFQFPIIENDKFIGFVDIIENKAFKFDKDKINEIPVPVKLEGLVSETKEKIKENVAETSEELMEKFFGNEDYTPEEMQAGLKKAILAGDMAPVLCCGAVGNAGVREISDFIGKYMPAPSDMPVVKAKKAGSEDEVDVKQDPAGPCSIFIYKTIADAFVGKISLFRVYSGTIKPDMSLVNMTAGKPEKITQLFMMRGKKQINVDKIVAGDIGAIAKLQISNTNDTLCDASMKIQFKPIEFPDPVLSMAVEPKTKGDDDKIGVGLHKLQDEDPTFKVSLNTETHQTLISGVGVQHLDIIVSKLKSKFNVSVNMIDPKVPYRETIKKKVKVEGKHKKQSGGHGQFGHVWIEFEPGPTEDLTFEEKIFGGSVPKQYFPAVEKGLRESIVRGVLARYPVVNLKATLVDGSFHAVDSSEMAFKIAANLAYKAGMLQAGSALLEPIARVEVYVPDSNMGDIIGDLNKRRGRIMGMNQVEGGLEQVVAEVPQAEMFKYATDLLSLTQGRGYFKIWFERYDEAPPLVAEKVIEEAKKHYQEEAEEE